jgi:hypothetical protein
MPGYKVEVGNPNVSLEQQSPFVIIDQEKNFAYFESFFLNKGPTGCCRAFFQLPTYSLLFGRLVGFLQIITTLWRWRARSVRC